MLSIKNITEKWHTALSRNHAEGNDWLTKKDEMRIITAYSVRPGDIKPFDTVEHIYVYSPAVKAGKAATLKIEQETPVTDRILVTHRDSEDHIVAVDTWERNDRGLYQWVCRNPAGMPQTKPAGRKPHPEKLDERADQIHKLISEGKTDKEVMKELGISRATYYRTKKRK